MEQRHSKSSRCSSCCLSRICGCGEMSQTRGHPACRRFERPPIVKPVDNQYKLGPDVSWLREAAEAFSIPLKYKQDAGTSLAGRNKDRAALMDDILAAAKTEALSACWSSHGSKGDTTTSCSANIHAPVGVIPSQPKASSATTDTDGRYAEDVWGMSGHNDGGRGNKLADSSKGRAEAGWNLDECRQLLLRLGPADLEQRLLQKPVEARQSSQRNQLAKRSCGCFCCFLKTTPSKWHNRHVQSQS